MTSHQRIYPCQVFSVSCVNSFLWVYFVSTSLLKFSVKEMEDLDFITTLAYFLNVGVFSAVISRFSGAPISILVCCAVLYVGATPLETIGIMLTYLVFMRLTIYTQKNRVNSLFSQSKCPITLAAVPLTQFNALLCNI